MSKKQASRHVGNIISKRDVVMGNQTNITLAADLERIERLLSEIIAVLREPQATVRVEQDGHGNITVMGDGNTVQVTRQDVDRFAALQSSATSQQREEIYLTRYILGETYARWTHLYLPLAGQLLEAPLRLTDHADQGVSAAGLPLADIREAVTRFNKTRLVILGDPGAGKTTTLHRLALDLARERLRDPVRGKLPVRVDLFNFIGKDQLPADFLRAQWETTGLDETYGGALARGQVCLLLDGVNQMPLADRSARIERWAAWANSDADLPAGNWAIFTCRSADYVTDLRMPEVRVQSLDPDRMKRYFQLRFPAGVVDQHWHTFEQRLRSGDDRFERLARNPFMLALLADRAAEGLSLHVSRATLMDDLAERRIKHELTLGRQPESLTADPRGTGAATLEALARIAFTLQTQGEGTRFTRASVRRVALAGTGQLRLTLEDVINLGASATLLDVAEGAGETAVYTFYHHLLQEYFAARELLRRFRVGQHLRRHWRVPWRWWQLWSRPLLPGERLPLPPVTGWEETVVMTAGLAGKDAARFILAVQDGNLPLAGRCLAEAGTDREDLRPLAEAVRRDLLARQRTTTGWLHRPHLRARIDAGLALGEVGHPDLTPQKFEFEGRTVWAIAPPMQDVPAGQFIRGSEPTDKRAFSDEYTTERTLTLPAFRMGRYPVTNAEFRFFIEDGGYTENRWWSDAGQKWKEGGTEAHKAAIQDWLDQRAFLSTQNLQRFAQQQSLRPQWVTYWKEMTQLSDEEARERAGQVFDRPFDRPGFWDDPTLNRPARPVVGVNWYEAEAYSNWLSAITGQKFRLPSEMEWEKAARGDAGREYPWGEKFDPALCNTVESHIYTTTPIGLYSDGQSPYKLFDVSGNVWEWTADWYTMYPDGEPLDDFGEKFRTVRGGSWNNNRRYARCAYRLRNVPDNFNSLIGFRICSPGSYS